MATSGVYDDGGFSGGSMERPALKQLLEDIAAKRVDTVIVYKVDRLTRSLIDFAKIVEQFDQQGVSFVSVTQQFNTTTSMGRLTLNVLLSFAQFEREVTGERIRDKIAASKRKGMWMGGVVPLGYDLVDRTLRVNEAEATAVREIFAGYLRLGCVSKLHRYLQEHGIVSKLRLSGSGRASGGGALSRGALYELLRNRIYLGQITHKGVPFAGQHPAILEEELWSQVQAQLLANLQARRHRARSTEPSLLAGLLADASGIPFTPTHASKGGRRYRYYTSQAEGNDQTKGKPMRLPAAEMEGVVTRRVVELLQSPQTLLDALSSSQDLDEVQGTLRVLDLQIAISHRELSTWWKAAFARSSSMQIICKSPSVKNGSGPCLPDLELRHVALRLRISFYWTRLVPWRAVVGYSEPFYLPRPYMEGGRTQF